MIIFRKKENFTQTNDVEILLDNFECKIIAESNKKPLNNSIKYHINPDGAGIIKSNNGGWFYLSNCELFNGFLFDSAIILNSKLSNKISTSLV